MSARFSRRDRVGEGDQPAGFGDMQCLDEAALEAEGAFPGRARLGIGGDQPARPRHLLGARRERLVGRPDLVRMDQRLAVKAEIAALPAGGGETFGIR